jgi:hypothetical protein
MQRVGILLAGTSDNRQHPAILAIGKQLLPGVRQAKCLLSIAL